MRRTPRQRLLCLAPPALLGAALLCTGALRAAGLVTERDRYAGKTVVLNELCAKNLTIRLDDAARADWIELYNPTDVAYELGGCFLSDKTAAPDLWQFPDGTVLPAGEYLVVFADGGDTGLHTNFRLSGSGGTLTLRDADGAVLDELSYPALAYDTTYGRRRLDGQSAGLFSAATPGSANPLDFWQREVATADLGVVEFSQQGGFYDEPVTLALQSPDPEAIILYTLDGSDPGMSSDFYTAPLTLEDRSELLNRYVSQPSTLDIGYWLKNYAVRYAPDPVAKATTVTARLYKNGVLGKAVTANSYWVGVTPYTLPVVSVTAEADELFGQNGIYLPGTTYFTLRRFGQTGLTGNYSAGQVVAAHFQILAANGTALSQGSGSVKVTGGLSRAVTPLKNLQLRLDAPADGLIPGVGPLDSLTLRGSGGGSIHFSLHKDAFWNNYLLGTDAGQSLGVRANQPAILFLQDEYWGVYTMRERLDDGFFERHFGLTRGEVLCPEEGVPADEAVMRALAAEVDALTPGSDAAYEWADTHFDLSNYYDWLIVQMYTGNLDGLYSDGNNTVLWRSTVESKNSAYADGRWRFVLNDLDATMFDDDDEPVAPLLEGDYTPDGPLAKGLNWYCLPCNLFQKLWGNARFRAEFTAAATTALTTLYTPESLLPAFEAWCEMLRPELAQDIARGQIIPNALAPLADALTDSPSPESVLTQEEWYQNAAAVRLYLQRRTEFLLAALG